MRIYNNIIHLTCVCIENVEYNSCPAISCCVCSSIRFGTRRYIYVIIIILLHYYYYLPPPLKRLRHPITNIHYNIILMLSCAHHRRWRRPLLCYIYPATTGRCICAYICVMVVRWRHPGSSFRSCGPREECQIDRMAIFPPRDTDTRASDRERV